jgi:hypothetical protein
MDSVLNPTEDDKVKGAFSLNLGAVTCTFKRQIRPYQSYELWTRVLTWDEKWLYLVTHIVESDKVKPRGYSLQPWKKVRTTVARENGSKTPNSRIFAWSIARYVFKRGRNTIPPETVLATAGLLPVKSMDHSPVQSSSVDPTQGGDAIRRLPLADGPPAEEGSVESSTRPEVWDWERVENIRAKGLKLAMTIQGLDEAPLEFTGAMEPALGHY